MGCLIRLRPRVFIAWAAAIWGLRFPGFGSWWDGPITVTQRATERSSYRRATQHAGNLPDNQVPRAGSGYSLTAPSRSAIDLAVGPPLPQALVLLDAAARLTCASSVPSPRRKDLDLQAIPLMHGKQREELEDEVARGQ